jgi:hypothetical protein
MKILVPQGVIAIYSD